MANLIQKDGIYVVRFRFESKEYKRSLKTRDKTAADAARNSVGLTIHRLLTGMLRVPHDVDPGDFIVSGGTQAAPRVARKVQAARACRAAPTIICGSWSRRLS